MDASRATPRLEPLPEGFATTRDALHRVAELVVAPARKPHNEIGLRQTPGGFGTPVFAFDGMPCQVRVEGAELVVRRGEELRREGLTTLAGAAALVGAALLPEGLPDDTEPLGVEASAAARLADWYAFGRAVLAHLRCEWDGDGRMDPSLTQLWPEHFDLALEAGPDAEGRRANYGASPGDDARPEPYLYVGPWTAAVGGPLWQAEGFRGAELRYSDIVAAEDQLGAAVGFLAERAQALEQLEVDG